MDQLGAPTRVEMRRGTRSLQAAAVSASMVLATTAGGWPFAGGEAVERLVVSSQAPAPELPTPRRAADDTRSPLSVPPGAGAAVSTTAATSVVVVDGPVEDVAGTARAMAAYRAAADVVAAQDPGCRLSWPLLAGIGLVESGHGTVHGSQLDAGGKAAPAILGPRLDGGGYALITDTDGGVFDGDVELDRAVGPMQFIPGTWARWGSDGDGDGIADPQDVDDAALAAGRYLCASGGRLDGPAGLVSAVFSYNHSYDYVRLVLTVTARYAGVAPAVLGVDRLPAPEPTPPPVVGTAPAAEPAPAPAGEPAEPAPGPAPEQAPAEPAPDGGPPAEPGPGPEETPPAEGGPAEPPACPVLPTDPPGDPACPPVEAVPTQEPTGEPAADLGEPAAATS